MKLINKWKELFRTNKLLTILGIIVVVAGFTGAIALGATIIHNNTNKEDIAESQTLKEEEESELKIEISKEDYYEEELALDEDTENEIYEEVSTETSTWTPVDCPYFIRVNRLMNVVTIYARDELGNYSVPVKAMLCSVGANGGTPTGVFHTSTKYLWRALYGNVYGQYAYRINGPILFHSVPYMVNGDKGSLEPGEYNKLGTAASMGCVRLAAVDAQWLMENCPSGTTVEIYDSEDPGPLGKPSGIQVDPAHPYAGWDPTDTDPANPWRTIPPTISGVAATRTIGRGENIDLMEGVSAIAFDGTGLAVSVSGNVDTNKVGKYLVTYSAVDAYGNTSTANCEYEVTKKLMVTVSGPVTITDTIYDAGDDALTSGMVMAAIMDAAESQGVSIVADDGEAEADIDRDTKSLLDMVAGVKKQNLQEEANSATYTVKVRAVDAAGNFSDAWVPITVTYSFTPEEIVPATEEIPTTELPTEMETVYSDTEN